MLIVASEQKLEDNHDPLAHAIGLLGSGNAKDVPAYLEAHPEVIGQRDDSGGTVLNAAVVAGVPEIVEFLIGKRVDVSVTDNKGQDALMFACTQNNVDIARMLLNSGANPNATSKEGASALFSAAANGQSDFVSALVEHGADVEKRGALVAAGTQLSLTPVQIAVLNGQTDVLAVLAKAGANVRSRESNMGYYTIHFAVLAIASGKGTTATIRRLVELGARINAEDHSANTPLNLAESLSQHEAAEVIREIGGKDLVVLLLPPSTKILIFSRFWSFGAGETKY